jgi:ligand-binding sensor domain-containing protein/DNA-binding CsgD family transcriptional regulator
MINSRRVINIGTLLIFLHSTVLFGQVKSLGIAYVKNFTKSMYKCHPKNMAIAQDKKGIMYFGNGDGLLQFDGVNWNLLRMPNKSSVISLCIDPSNDRLYVGAQGEFGYVTPDSIGNLKYTSLSITLPKSIMGFGDIWKISVNNGELTAVASNMVMVLRNNKDWSIIKPAQFFYPGFEVRNKVFVYEGGKGIWQLDNDKLIPINGADIFKTKGVAMMVPYRDRKIVMGTGDGDLFIYDGQRVTPWKTEADNFLTKNKIETGVTMSDGSIAIATHDNGLLVISETGKPLQHINLSRGLQSSSIIKMFCDNNGNLWLALENGIDYVELNSPFTYFNEELKLFGSGYSSATFNNKLYLATSHGVYSKDWREYENPVEHVSQFELIENTDGQAWNLNSKYGELLVGHNNGTYKIKDNKGILLDKNNGSWMFLQWQKHPELLLEGNYSTLSILEKGTGDAWNYRNTLLEFRESFRIMEEDQDGKIWLSHPHKGVYRIKIGERLNAYDSIRFYNSTNGLPTDFNNYVSKANDKVLFLTEKGVYQYNNKTDRFEPDAQFEKFFSGKPVSKLIEDLHGNIWYVSENRPGKLVKRNNGYERSDEQFGKLEGKLVANFEHINPIDDKNILFGTDKGFVHYDPSRVSKTKVPFYVHVRRVEDLNNNKFIADELYTSTDDSLQSRSIQLSYDQNAIQFNFSCTSYQDIEKNQYQYKLEGFDRVWSEWTSRTQKEYTNLPEGKYIFKVRAKNFDNEVGKEANFKFKISPPFYRTQTAYFLYGILVLLSIAGAVRLINLQKEKQFKQEQLKSEKKIIKLENEKLESEVSFKHRELASLALNLTSKNEMLDQIKSQLKSFSGKLETEGKAELTQIIKLIDNNSKLDNDWKKFEFYFDQVHSNFLKQLKEKYPDLTISQMKLCAYLRMNLSTKEIATLMNISVAGIEKSRYRLRRKFNLDHDRMLTDFIQGI